MRSSAIGFVVLSVALGTAGCGGCGDDGSGGAPDGGGFVLVSRTPDDGDGNAWVYDPIVLEFSQPVDPASVTAETVALAIGDAPLAHEVAVSEDGITVTALVSEPPPTPAPVTVTVTPELTSAAGEAFAGASWSFTLPVWQHPAAAGPAGASGAPALAIDTAGMPIVAWAGPDGVVVRRLDGGAWVDLLDAPLAADQVRMASAGSEPILALASGGDLTVQAMVGGSWQALGAPFSAAVVAFDVAVGSDGVPVVAAATAGEVQHARWDGSGWQLGVPLALAGASELALAVGGETALVAVIDQDRTLRVFREGAGAEAAWSELAGGIDTSSAERPDLAAIGSAVAVGWQKDDAGALATRHIYAATWSGASWQRNAHAADLDLQSDALGPSLTFDALGRAVIAWYEGDATSRKVYVARAATDDDNWTFMDSAANRDPAADAEAPALALDVRGHPVLAMREGGEIVVARWNGSPGLRRGLAERLPAGACAIDPDSPPATLGATGCYADVAGHEPAAQLVPYEVSAPLWSDGALKRRFLLVPDGASLGYSPVGPFTVPVGTLLVKEFWLERVAEDPASRFPVETRFLVKRCEEGDCLEPWQGYSYRWREDGSEADLIAPGSSDERTGWTITTAGGEEVVHTHIYPARLNCTRCHNAPAGRVLGLQAAQLDRPASYRGVIDGQLDALAAVGLLSGAEAGADVSRLPSPLDPSWNAGPRSRAYYHANCAQCHRPNGERPSIDFRYQAALAADNICNVVTPGDGTGSTLYQKDATRGAGQMPPLATDLADAYQLAITAAWIDGMTTCP